MSYSTIMQNILSPVLSLSGKSPKKDLKILYDHSDTLFDKFLKEYLDISLMYESEYVRTRGMFFYDIYWNNNPVQYISNAELYKNEHILDMVFFHELPEASLKKEDKFLLQNRLRDSLIIYMNKSLKNEWSIGNGKHIAYGIPEQEIDLGHPRKSVVVLNPNGAKSIEFLYSHIKQYFSDTTILSIDKHTSYNDITNILKQHDVCVSIKKSFDSMVALSCGCDVLSSSVLEEDGIKNIDDFNKIHLEIELVLKSRNKDKIKERTNNLIKKYDLVKFQNEIYNTIIDRIRRPFVL